MEQFNLENSPKIEPGFKIPENYFETFENKLMQKLEGKTNKPKIKVLQLFSIKKIVISGIAAVLTVSMGIYFYNQNSENDLNLNTEEIALENYSTEEIALLLTDNEVLELEKNILDLENTNQEFIENNIY